MTLNILFLTVTIKKRSQSVKQALRNEEISKRYEENRDRLARFQRLL